MRFRDTLSRHVVVPWESYYIPYSQLKALLKVASSTGQLPSAEFYARFGDSISATHVFLLKQQTWLRHDEDQLEARWSCVSQRREELIFLSLATLRDALYEILLFCRINYEAIKRIYAKVTSSVSTHDPGVGSAIGAQITNYRETYTECVNALERIQARLLECKLPYPRSSPLF
jgi:SPX domain protein involved in polyphosphate accumulation